VSPIEQIAIVAETLFERNDWVEIRMLKEGKVQRLCDKAKWLKTYTETLQKENKQFNLFFGCNPRKFKRGTKNEHVGQARCLVVDMDNISRKEAARRLDRAKLPRPTLVIWSGGGVHAYWRLAYPITRMIEWTEIQKRLIGLLKSDKVVCDAARIMRLPGFFNHKPGRSVAEIIDHDKQRVYDLVEIEGFLPKLNAKPAATAIKHPLLAPIANDRLYRRARSYLQRIPPALAGQHGHDRTFRFACVLCKFCLPENQAWTLLQDYNARCLPPWSERELRHKLESAKQNYLQTTTPKILN